MRENLPFVSIIIPCRNEEKYVGKCVESVLNQTFPKEKMEILVIDGMSTDKTREIVRRYSEVRILDNPKKIFPAANNIGIRNAKGEFLIIMGAHAVYSLDYVEKCIKHLMANPDADNVGGILRPSSAKDTIIAKAITLSLGGRFGKGREEKEKEKSGEEVDTVFGGCYRKEVFKKMGLFNENLVGSSDMDLNLRLLRSGGKTLLVPGVVVYYYPKDNLKDFFFHNIRDGIWAILPFKFTKRTMKLRHYIPLVFVLSLPLSIWLYIPLTFYFSAKIALREKEIRYFFLMPIVFATRHIGYGLGSVWGLIKLII